MSFDQEDRSSSGVAALEVEVAVDCGCSGVVALEALEY